MFKRNQIQKTIVLAGVTLASCVAVAQETATTTATVTVQNAFTLTEDSGLNFGTITASRVSGGTVGSLVLGPDGTNNNPAGGIRVLVTGTPATYSVSGAASFTDLSASIAADSVTLSNPVAPASNPDFTVSSFTLTDGTTTGALNSGGISGLTTDVNGALSLGIGATLTLPDGADSTLIDGDYTGTFTLTVNY